MLCVLFYIDLLKFLINSRIEYLIEFYFVLFFFNKFFSPVFDMCVPLVSPPQLPPSPPLLFLIGIYCMWNYERKLHNEHDTRTLTSANQFIHSKHWKEKVRKKIIAASSIFMNTWDSNLDRMRVCNRNWSDECCINFGLWNEDNAEYFGCVFIFIQSFVLQAQSLQWCKPRWTFGLLVAIWRLWARFNDAKRLCKIPKCTKAEPTVSHTYTHTSKLRSALVQLWLFFHSIPFPFRDFYLTQTHNHFIHNGFFPPLLVFVCVLVCWYSKTLFWKRWVQWMHIHMCTSANSLLLKGALWFIYFYMAVALHSCFEHTAFCKTEEKKHFESMERKK